MKRILFILPIVIVLFGSCSSTKFTTNYDKSIDFSKYKTLEYYGWTEGSSHRLSTFDKQRIEQAFGREFKRRGIEVVSKGSGGDLFASLYIVKQNKTSYSATTVSTGGGYYGYGYGGFYGYGPGWGYGSGYSTTSVHAVDYKVGTLICSVFDANNKVLIWEGVISGTINENADERARNTPKMIGYLMKKYPVKPKK